MTCGWFTGASFSKRSSSLTLSRVGSDEPREVQDPEEEQGDRVGDGQVRRSDLLGGICLKDS